MGRVAKQIVCLWAAGLVPVVAAAVPDVRILLDASQRMVQADPQNQRLAALQVLLRMLPRGSYAGIWAYGSDAHALMDHGPVTGLWRETAFIKIRGLSASGPSSDLSQALAAATWDATQATDRQRHVVVLTAGGIHMAGAAARTSAARREVLTTGLATLQSAGITVHTLGLGDAIDSVLLEQLALVTNGYHAEVARPEGLLPAVVKLLDHALPPARLPPRVAGTFRVDAGIDEITVLRLRQDNDPDLVLQSPLGRRFSRTTPRAEVKWHQGEHYDLLSLRDPTPGDWRFRAGHTGQTRVLAMGDLSMHLSGLAGVMFPGGPKTFALALDSRGTPISDSTFLELLQVAAVLETPSVSQPLVVEAQSDGGFALHLLELGESGDHVLRVQLRGPTFERELVVPFVVRNPVTLEIRPAPEGATLWVDVSAPGVDPATLRVAATVRQPPGPAKILPAQAFPAGLWKIAVSGTQRSYDLSLDIAGKYLNGKDFKLESDRLSLTFPLVRPATVSLDGSGKQIRAALQAATAPSAPPAATAAAPPAAGSAAEPAAEPPLLLPVWFVGVVGILGVALVGAFWWLLKPSAQAHGLPGEVANLRALLGDAEAQPS